MPRGGRREGAGAKRKYVPPLGAAADAVAKRLLRIAAAAKDIETRAGRLAAALPDDRDAGAFGARVAALAELADEIAAERVAILAVLRAEPSSGADAGRQFVLGLDTTGADEGERRE